MSGRISPLSLLTFSWVLLASAGAGAQTFTISGRVVDKDNQPAPGVRVTVQRGAALIESKITGKTGDYNITFPAGDPVTIIYAGGGWLPTKVQNLSGRINHSLGKVLSRQTEAASITQTEADDVASTLKYFEMYPTLYAQEIAEYKDIPLNKKYGPDRRVPYEEVAQVKKKKLPPGFRGFEQLAKLDVRSRSIGHKFVRPHPGPEPHTTDSDHAEQLYQQGKYAEAAESFMKAAKANPMLFDARFGLGMSYEALGRYNEAIAAYREALKLRPGEAWAYFNLGISHSKLSQWQEAIAAFHQAFLLDPRFAEAMYNLGVAHSMNERYAEAVTAFKRTVELKPDYAEAYYNLGLIYYMTDDQIGFMEQQKYLRAHKPELANELAKLNTK